MGQQRAAGGGNGDAVDGRIDVLCIGDRSSSGAISEAAKDADAPISVAWTTDRRRIRTVAEARTIDCVVIDGSLSEHIHEQVRQIQTLPVVLYTETDPANVSDELLDVVDTLVDRGDPGDTAPFLIEKVVGLVSEREEKSEYALAQALARVDDDAACEGYQFLVEPDGTICWASEPFETVFPVDAAADSGGFYERLVALLGDRPSAIRTVTRAQRGVDATSETVVELPTDDETRHFSHSAHELPDSVGSLRLEVFRDVTPQVQREARLELLDLLVEQAQDGLYTLDENGVIDFCNESFAEMLGYERTEIIGRHASTTLAEGELEKGQRTLRHLERTDEESATVDMTFLDRAGTRLEVSIHYTLLPSEDGSYAGLMGVVRDITERKERERALEQYQTLVESAGDPMYVLDAEGRIELLNEPMASFFGREKDAVVGERINELLPEAGGERGDRALKSILGDESRTFESFESWLADANGIQRLYEVTVGVIEDDGEFVGSVGTLRDITERERRREELDLLRQVFARVLRHNLRSELSIIMGNTEVVMEELEGPNRELAGTVLERGRRLEETARKARAIESVLDSEAGRTTQRVEQVVDRAVTAVEDEHPEAVIETDGSSSLSVRAHPNLVVAVENLVDNAVEHGEALGTCDARVEVESDRDGVSLSVVDGGPGLPECERKALNQESETPLEHGSGLGLWLVNWIVERSGGALGFDHTDGRTTVTIELDGDPESGPD
ncbi:PAS domain S-box protein [Halomicrobium sp. IBSBa]|uniref:PAS domain-containing protein n=1 Tax=Halomicrobium sp. IBSBa TaxID=2778916 RepID=UPI001ABF7350|nr:PAS domain S-box protein [Halomicrobium sp. IBSBa]MBO4246774.1 PAS domain S-box protein [Halomicrobium sp. IBSBa]